MESISFQFDKSLYKQTYGTPMGSPISPIIADIVMQDLEENCLSNFDFTIPLYFRYVDDTLILIPNNKIQIRNHDNSTITDWYRKDKDYGRFLNLFSKHPTHQKIGVIKNLVDQAILLSDKSFYQNNLKTVFDLLFLNNFPSEIIKKHINNRIHEIHMKKNNLISKVIDDNSQLLQKPIITFPYYGNISEKIKTFINKLGVRTVFRSGTKLSKFIKVGKDPLDKMDKKNVACKINCKCRKCYIGLTKHPLRIRRKQHFDNIKLNEKHNNVISKHLKENEDDINHCFLLEKTSVL